MSMSAPAQAPYSRSYESPNRVTEARSLGTNPDFSWYAVRVPTNVIATGTAWVSADLVTLINPSGRPLQIITPPLLPNSIDFADPPLAAPQVVMTEPATIRSGPSPEFPVLGVAPLGSRAEVKGQSQDGAWWAIQIPSWSGGETAWVAKLFTSESNIGNPPTLNTPSLPRNITPATPASGAPALLTSEPLNVYNGPGEPYKLMGRVSAGTTLAVVGVSQDRAWFVVNIPTTIDPGGQGWVLSGSSTAQNTAGVHVIQPPPLP